MELYLHARKRGKVAIKKHLIGFRFNPNTEKIDVAFDDGDTIPIPEHDLTFFVMKRVIELNPFIGEPWLVLSQLFFISGDLDLEGGGNEELDLEVVVLRVFWHPPLTFSQISKNDDFMVLYVYEMKIRWKFWKVREGVSKYM